ncbi:MAG: class I SAM-dependent methyltransferase [Gammaproteobacteria bacterium]
MSDTTFKDHFSAQSPDYRAFRPRYPEGLFEFLSGLAPARVLAWDCATGNGQAAVGLARHFDRVIATDASANQLAQAIVVANVDYRQAPAERAPLDDAAVDLIVVAQALHWFDVDAFHREAARVLKDGGVIAAWSYNLLSVSPAIDAVVGRLYAETLAGYWPAERRLVETGYRDLPFPFERIEAPAFALRAQWDLRALAGYLQTWSAVQRYLAARGRNPVEAVLPELAAAWGEAGSVRPVAWPLTLRVGRHRRR